MTTKASEGVLDEVLRPIVGEVRSFIGTSSPTGWLILNGETIGSAGSGADNASAVYEELFSLFWDSMADAQAPVSTGRGASAAADFAADKTLTIPDSRGRSLIGTGTGGGGLTARVHGDTEGAETHQLTAGEIPSTGLTYQKETSHGGQVGAGAAGLAQTPAETALTNANDDAHNNMSPWLALNFIIKW